MSISDTILSNTNTIYLNQKEVFEAGKNQQDKEFWKEYQTGVSRNYINVMFAGPHWTEATFNPKYDIQPNSTAEYLFFFNNVQDLDAAIRKAGIIFDLSGCKNLNSLFRNYTGQIVPVISTISCGISDTYLFAYSSTLTTIKRLIVKNDGTQNFTGWFTSCSSLSNIVIEGVIGQNFDIKDSPLTKESIESIVNALSTASTGKTVSFKKSAKESAFTEDEWNALISTKQNWTFSLV